MNKTNFEQALVDKLADLDKDKQPDRDLWPGIELALSSETSEQSRTLVGKKMYLVAATVAMFGLLGWLSINQQAVSLTGDALVASLSEQHLKQKNALLVRFQDQPALTENWQSQLTELDDAAVAIKTALENEPNNMALLKMLQSVYQQQINLIERVHSPKWSQI
ncbi:hypothetical protein [Paraglaciecola arctica]|uniref:Uncharacterized protein n=1 Tax=Paraglaciecola arctica BSs20135 TaxID=493475 RepID=K6Y9T0_9ALTE|nr:hypothetical protein [Paraglaciecola arctica]GAC20711.1 hypothetical protein GARC_3757 [Paraglaciecola arctica BSs20135]